MEQAKTPTKASEKLIADKQKLALLNKKARVLQAAINKKERQHDTRLKVMLGAQFLSAIRNRELIIREGEPRAYHIIDKVLDYLSCHPTPSNKIIHADLLVVFHGLQDSIRERLRRKAEAEGQVRTPYRVEPLPRRR